MTEFASNLSELAASVQQEEVMKDLLGNFKVLHDDLESNKFASLPLFRYVRMEVVQCKYWALHSALYVTCFLLLDHKRSTSARD